MAAPVIQKAYIQDINRPIEVRHGGGLMFTGDANADRISVALYDCQTPFALSGSVTGTCIRNDGQTVVLTGGILGGNTAYVVLAQSCFVVPGPLAVTIRVSAGGVSTTVLKAMYTIDQTTTEEIVDPGHVVPDISDIVAEYARMQAASDAAEAAAANANEAAKMDAHDAYINSDMQVSGRTYQTLRPGSFELLQTGALLDVIRGNEAQAHIVPNGDGWNVYKYDFGQTMIIRLIDVERSMQGVLLAAAEITNGNTTTYWSMDEQRKENFFLADAILMNVHSTSGPAANGICITSTAHRDFEDVIVCADHVGEFDNIIAFGDSIFAGDGLSAGQGVVAQFASMMGLPVTNYAVGGATLTTRQSTYKNLVQQVRDYRATIPEGTRPSGTPLYILDGGTNDPIVRNTSSFEGVCHWNINMGQYGTDDTLTVYGAIKTCINDLLGLGIQPWQIVVTTPIPKGIRANNAWGFAKWNAAQYVEAMNAVLTAIGYAMYEVGVAQMCNVINGYRSIFGNLDAPESRLLMMTDDTHPTQYGAKHYAERIFTLLGMATQREVTELKSAITNTLDYNGIGNAFDGELYAGYWNASGTRVSYQNLDVCNANKIVCPENARVVIDVKINIENPAYFISYLDDSTRIKRDTGVGTHYIGISPTGTKYVCFAFEKSGLQIDDVHYVGVYINNKIDEMDTAIGYTKSAVNNLYDNKKTIFYVLYPGFIGGDGSIQRTDATNQYVYTSKIAVMPGGKIDLSFEWETTNSQWVAIATYNELEEFTARTVLYNSTGNVCNTEYTVPSGVGYISITYKTYGAANLSITQQIELNPDSFPDGSIQGSKLEAGSINQNVLSFAEHILPVNLFDYTSEDMCKPGWWYYDTTIGNVVSAKTSGSTTHYVAIKVPVYDSTKITLGIYPNDNARLVYWVGAVDADMRLIAYSIVNQNAPVTYDLPTGAVYFLASYSLGSANFETYLPRVMAVNADAITGYSAYFKPYYKLLDCKTDVDDSESITNLQSIVGSDENSVTLELPDKYDLVVGDTFQLFFKGIINAVNTDMYYVLVDCAKGNAYSRYFEVTPDSAGNITATFTLFGINHNVLDTKTVTLAVHAKPSSPASTKNVLCVGDSLTTAGQWVEEFHRRLTGSGGTPVGDNLSNVNFIGTRVSNNVHYEGYGGWTIRSYNTENVSFNVREITCTHDKTEATDQHSVYRGPDGVLWKLETIRSDTIKIIAVSGEGRNFPNSGTLTWVSGGTNHSDIVYTAQQMAAGNPFWDSTANKVDFSKYATSLGISSIDYVYVLIGWNSASWSESDYKADVQTFIDNVHASFPNAVIVFSGLEIPAQDGLGNNYGATGTYSRYYDLMQFVFNLDKWYAEVAEVNSNTYSYNLSGQFDTEYNMLTATRPANTRNSTEVTYQSNGVHPALSGQMQIADAAYRDIAARL